MYTQYTLLNQKQKQLTHLTQTKLFNMARTNKWTVRESQAAPRYFSKHGNFGEAPNNVKKDGSGKSNWGTVGDEINDLVNSGEIPPVFNKHRRGSNTQMNERRLSDVQNNHE